MHFIRQNSGTAAGSGDTVEIGPVLDAAGAEYTGLVIGDLTLAKNGIAAAMAANATLTHTSNGYYDLVMIGNNADTIGKMSIRSNKVGYQFPPKEYQVLTQAAYDKLFGTTAIGPLSLQQARDAMKLAATAGAADPDSIDDRLIDIFTEIPDPALTAQQTRDAMKLAPSVGASAEASIDDTLDEIQSTVSAIDPPTVEEIAEEVAIELDPEFDQIDTATSAIVTAIASLSTIVTNGFSTMVTGFTNTATLIGAVPLAVWNVLTSALTTIGSIGKWLLDNAGGSAVDPQDIRDAMKLSPSVGEPEDGSIDDLILSIDSGGGGGNGDGVHQIFLNIKDDDEILIPNCDVALTTGSDSPNTGVVGTNESNGSGVADFFVDPGTYYVWRQKTGKNFTDNPQTIVVDEDGNVTEG